MLLLFFVVFFFKQKTAYEMRISDWSSDVCSSDLQVAGLVGLPGLDQRDVGNQCGLQHVVPAVDLARLLALCDHGAVAGGGEERRNSRTAGAQALGQGALRVEFELELTGQE